MTPEKRKEELLYGLERTSAEEVFVDITHVAEVLGIEKAEELAKSLVHMTQQVTMKTSKSAILPGKDRIQGGIMGVVRQDLVDELKAHRFSPFSNHDLES